MIKHPSSLNVYGELKEICQQSKKSNSPKVLFDGTRILRMLQFRERNSYEQG